VRRVEAIARQDPHTPRWRVDLANALALHATSLIVLGDGRASLERRLQATALSDALVATDPANRAWARLAHFLRLKAAQLFLAEGDGATAARLVDEARRGLEALGAAEPADRQLNVRLATAWRLEAELRHAAGRADAAEAVARALAIGEEILGEKRANDEAAGEFAEALVTAGEIAAGQGELDAARTHWERAIAVLAPRLVDSSHWRILDPAARAYALGGRLERSREIIGRLEGFGYRPRKPWPPEAGKNLSGNHNH
jgi:tetratricopeptide (TPR) repeat protein